MSDVTNIRYEPAFVNTPAHVFWFVSIYLFRTVLRGGYSPKDSLFAGLRGRRG
jgi:hypothetical protein